MFPAFRKFLKEEFHCKRRKAMSQLLNICAMQTCAKEAYGNKLPEIKVTSEVKVLQLNQATEATLSSHVGKLNGGKKDKAVSSDGNILKHLIWLQTLQ